MNHRRVTALLALVLLWTLGACTKDENEDRTDPEGSPVRSTAQQSPPRRQPAGPPPVSEATEIRLIDPGEEPRSPITYSFEPGQQESMVADMELSGSIGGEGETSYPTIRIQADLEVAERDERGRYRLLMKVGDFEVVPSPSADPELVERARRNFESWPTLEGVVLVGANGASQGFELRVPGDASDVMRQMADSIKQSLRQILVAFPEEPIGKGARWAVATSASFQGMSFEQLETFTLHEKNGDVLRLSVSQEMASEQTQRLDPRVDLLELSAKGAGTYRVELDRLVAESQMQVRWTMVTSQNGEKTEDVISNQISTYRR